MTSTTTSPIKLGVQAPTGPRLLLADHHRALEAACTELRVAALVDNRADMVACYRNFEHAITEHIAAEEDLILPGYAAHAPEDAATIRAQHAKLREQLYALGIDVELHYIRLESLDQLIATLRANAAHEDLGMYPWAQVNLRLRDRGELYVRIGRSFRALRHARTR